MFDLLSTPDTMTDCLIDEGDSVISDTDNIDIAESKPIDENDNNII